VWPMPSERRARHEGKSEDGKESRTVLFYTQAGTWAV
jgi:hypothetical protein